MKHAKALLGVCLAVLMLVCFGFGGEKIPKEDVLTGTWDCVAHLSGESDIPFTMKLEQKAEGVTGSITSTEGELEIKSGTYESNTLELHLETPQAKYLVTGKFDAAQLKGQWSKDPDGIGGDWEGKKAAPPEAPSR